MKKTFTIAFLCSLLSCTPYQKLFLSPKYSNTFLEDSCDVHMIVQLKQILDSTEYWTLQNPTILLDDIKLDASCEYYLKKLYHPQDKDSAIWLLTISPYQVKRKEVVVGNLYTFYPNQDSFIILERRVKEYEQYGEFESGQYIVLTYVIENGTTNSIELGPKEKLNWTTVR